MLQIGAFGEAPTEIKPVQGSWTGISVANFGHMSAFAASSQDSPRYQQESDLAACFETATQPATNGTGYALAAAELANVEDCSFTGGGILSLGREAAGDFHTVERSTFSPLPGGAYCTELLVEDDATIANVLLDGGVSGAPVERSA